MVHFNQINDNVTIAQASTLKVNAVVVECDHYLMVIDTLLLPSDIKALKQFLQQKNKPLKYLINTHWHSDHCLGNQLLKDEDTLIIAHQDYLQTLLTERSVLKTSASHSVNRKDISHPNIFVHNDFCFKDEFTYHLIESPGHCYGAICILIEELKILITGDTILGYPENFFSIPYFYWGDEISFMKSLKDLYRYNFEIIIPGHSEIQQKDLILFYLQYLVRIIQKKDELLDKDLKITFEDLKKEITLESCMEVCEIRKLWVPEMHDLNLQKLFLTYFQK